jgi:Cu/Ag efflux protein CusF
MTLIATAIAIAAATASEPLPANELHKSRGQAAELQMLAQASTEMTEAEVRKIDKEAKKITLKHGEIKNLEMPAMTMVFQVKDAAMLEQVKPGDKIKFAAEKVGSAYTVTVIESVK